jgi:hypothetical protein
MLRGLTFIFKTVELMKRKDGERKRERQEVEQENRRE